MARLLLIRHGQASFLASDYDVLSPLGEAQARSLGAHLAARGLAPDRVLAGSLRRQQHTAALAAEASAAPWPEIEPSPLLDEHQGDRLLREHLPALAASSPEAAALVAQAAEAPDPEARARAVARLLDHALRRWATGSIALIEPFAAFRARVRQAIEALTGRGRLVVAFTSGGVIGAAVAEALRSPDETAIELGMMSYNTAITEFLFSRGRLTLNRFNATPHLDDEALTAR